MEERVNKWFVNHRTWSAIVILFNKIFIYMIGIGLLGALLTIPVFMFHLGFWFGMATTLCYVFAAILLKAEFS